MYTNSGFGSLHLPDNVLRTLTITLKSTTAFTTPTKTRLIMRLTMVGPSELNYAANSTPTARMGLL